MVTKSIKALNKHLNNINRQYTPLLKEEYYNCWSLTAFLKNWKDSVCWLSEHNMEKYLTNNTKAVRIPQVGDIIEFRTKKANGYTDAGGLMHTAIITEIKKNGKRKEIICLHKPGGWEIEVRDLQGIKKMYGQYSNYIKYSRAVA